MDDDEYLELVAARVAKAWRAERYTGNDLAALLEVTPDTARAKLRGEREFRLRDLRKIAQKLGTTVGAFTD